MNTNYIGDHVSFYIFMSHVFLTYIIMSICSRSLINKAKVGCRHSFIAWQFCQRELETRFLVFKSTLLWGAVIIFSFSSTVIILNTISFVIYLIGDLTYYLIKSRRKSKSLKFKVTWIIHAAFGILSYLKRGKLEKCTI